MRKDKTDDWIYLHGLRLKCHIGVSPHERQKKQIITADIVLKCDLRRAGKSDCLKDTVDYAILAKTIAALAAKKSFCLLESLAENIAEICLANSKIQQVTIKAAKTGVLANIRSAGVEIHRTRNS